MPERTYVLNVDAKYLNTIRYDEGECPGTLDLYVLLYNEWGFLAETAQT